MGGEGQKGLPEGGAGDGSDGGGRGVLGGHAKGARGLGMADGGLFPVAQHTPIVRACLLQDVRPQPALQVLQLCCLDAYAASYESHSITTKECVADRASPILHNERQLSRYPDDSPRYCRIFPESAPQHSCQHCTDKMSCSLDRRQQHNQA